MANKTINPRQQDDAEDSDSQWVDPADSKDIPDTPAELLERIPTMSDEQNRALNAQRFGEPENKEPTYKTAGNEPSTHRGEPLSAGQDSKKAEPDREKLKEAEENGGPPQAEKSPAEKTGLAKHENQLGRGYTGGAGATITPRFWILKRRQTAIGGGIIGTILGSLIAFTIFSGPFQFIHISQLLQRFHFASQQNLQDDRFMHEVRWLRYAKSGEAQRARMGYLGNKFTNAFESKMVSSGLIPQYDKSFGNFIGYEIDTRSQESPYHGMSDDDAKKAVAANLGVEATSYDGKLNSSLKGKPMVEPPKGISGYFKARRFDSQVLRQNGLRALPAAVGSRLMAQRRGASLHPVNRLVIKTQENITAAREKWKQNRDSTVRKGTTPTIPGAAPDTTDPKTAGSADAQSAADAANNTVKETQTPGADLNKEGSKISSGARAAGGGIFAIGIACTLKHIDSRAGEIKDAQVVAPAIRMGVDAISVGEQAMSGQDIDFQTLGFYNSLLNGADSTGKKSSWIDAASIQGQLGNTGTGVAPSDTLKNATTTNSPFRALNSGTLGAALNTACSGTTGFVLNAIGFVGAGLTEILIAGVQGFFLDKVSNEAAHWIAGKAIDPDAVGADYGNTINYGARLAANDQAIAAGGRELSPGEENQLAAAVSLETRSEFDNHGLAYKLLNPYDSSSAISKVIDRTSPSISQNIAKMGSAFLNFGNIFSSLPNLFSPRVQAASSASYDYGFPAYGFSPAEMSDPRFENPFENACHVVGCPDKGINGFLVDASGNLAPGMEEKYIKRANFCFGVDISREEVHSSGSAIGLWTVTSTGSSTYEDIQKNNCDDTTDDNWMRLRFFILDTETMNSMACYIGDSTDQDSVQACSDIGFGTSSSNDSPPPTASNNPSGNAQSLAQQILGNSNILLTGREVSNDIQAAAKAKPGSAGVMTSSAILQLILTVGQTHSVMVSAIQSGGTGHCHDTPKASCPNDAHYTGDGVDFAVVDGTALTGRDKGSVAIINIATSLLPSGTGFGQVGCGPQVNLPTGFTQFADSCNHLHVQIPKGTP